MKFGQIIFLNYVIGMAFDKFIAHPKINVKTNLLFLRGRGEVEQLRGCVAYICFTNICCLGQQTNAMTWTLYSL